MGNRLNHDQIDAFVTVAETGSQTLAGTRLSVSQPAVRKRIKGLEETLGFPLFTRVGRKVVLSEKGREFLPEAKKLLEQERLTRDRSSFLVNVDLVRHAKEISRYAGVPDKIKIGYSRGPTEEFRDFMIRGISQHFGMRVISNELTVRECLESIANREIDFAVNVKPRDLAGSVVFIPLATYNWACAVAGDHRWIARGQVDFSELQQETLLILCPRRMVQYQKDLNALLATVGSSYSSKLDDYSGMEEILSGVSTKTGIAFLMEATSVRPFHGVSWVRVPQGSPRVDVGLILESPQTEFTAGLIRWIEDFLRPLRSLPFVLGSSRFGTAEMQEQ